MLNLGRTQVLKMKRKIKIKKGILMKKIYMDHAATTALHPVALKGMMPYLTNCYGNPSSGHGLGREAKKILMSEKKKILSILHGEEGDKIIFTSGGTESNNLAIKGFMATSEKKHFITSGIEHSSVLNVGKYLESQGYSVTYLPVDEYGLVSVEVLTQAITEETALVSCMYVNNEIGTIQNISALGEVCKEKGVVFHTDAVQAAGHLSLDVGRLGVSMLSISGHKFGGPKGVGCLYVKKNLLLQPLSHGGGQEDGFRSGTESMANIVGMGTALELVQNSRLEHEKQIGKVREIIQHGLLEIPEVYLTGHPEQRVPSLLSFVIHDVEGEGLLSLLEMNGVYCSAGSACASGSLQASHVLTAIAVPESRIHGGLRLSFGESTTEEEAEAVVVIVKKVVNALRKTRKRITQS